jgi:hypothetical protein
MKVVIGQELPAGCDFTPGAELDLNAKEMEVLDRANVPFVTASEHARITAQMSQHERERQTWTATVRATAERSVKDAVVRAKGRDAVPPKDEEVEKQALGQVQALDWKPEAVSLVVQAIDARAGKADKALSTRTTSSGDDSGFEAVHGGEVSMRETVRAYFKADEPFHKCLRTGGIMRAANNDAVKIMEVVKASQHRAVVCEKIADMVRTGGDLSEGMVRDVVKGAETYFEASGALGALNTGLLLQFNFGYLANQLPMLDDITTDISAQPVLFNQRARSRYITVPKLQLKTSSNAWTGGTGNSVDVDILMDTHAGVPIKIDNNILSATPRQLFNEQRQPMLYSLGEYIIYKLATNAFVGNTRTSNTGTTATITFNPGYTNPAAGDTFSVGGATLATFVADLPEAMDESKFPGGDESPGDNNLQRFVWVHGRVYATAAADSNFLLNSSIQGIRGQTGDNVMATGRFERIGNVKFRKSQLATDQVTATGSGADGTTNGIVITPGTYSSATYVGIAGTRSALMFVARTPIDYTQVLPDIPSTAAVEMATEPKTGITFLVVKFLDHAYETANMRVQLMFGTAIGDERQGMLLTRV